MLFGLLQLKDFIQEHEDISAAEAALAAAVPAPTAGLQLANHSALAMLQSERERARSLTILFICYLHFLLSKKRYMKLYLLYYYVIPSGYAKAQDVQGYFLIGRPVVFDAAKTHTCK